MFYLVDFPSSFFGLRAYIMDSMDLRARMIMPLREISKKHSFTYCRVKDFKYLKLGVSWSQRLNVNYVCVHFTIDLSEKISMLCIHIMFDFVNMLLYQF